MLNAAQSVPKWRALLKRKRVVCQNQFCFADGANCCQCALAELAPVGNKNTHRCRFHHHVLYRYLDDIDVGNAGGGIDPFGTHECPIGMQAMERGYRRWPNQGVDRIEQHSAGNMEPV